MEAARFPTACVASPHYLASAAGLGVLARGGNAVDAAVAMNLMLGVVAPYACGFGGDLLAMVWRGELFAYNGTGRAPAAATVEAVRASAGSDEMPVRGPLPVTVPGAVDGWFALLERFGTKSFGELAEPALRYAREGFPLTGVGVGQFAESRKELGGFEDWLAVYGGDLAPGRRLCQPALARTIEALGANGPDVYYRGPIASAIADQVQQLGGLMAIEDLAAHRGDWVEPLSIDYRGVQLFELPPNTQGVTALEALAIVGCEGPLPADPVEREHLLIEAVKLALADRDAYVTDPAFMTIPAEKLVSTEWVAGRRQRIDLSRALQLAPTSAGGDTAYMCAADGDGMCVSLIQSNFFGFGSGVTVPEWGINLHNRGESFSLDSSHANVIAPGKRTMHTLIPAMALRDGKPWLVFGSMGGHGQAQTHVQLLARIIDDGQDVQRAIAAPRWRVAPEDGSVLMERRFDSRVVEGLRALGHEVETTESYDSQLGHAHAIVIEDEGYAGATDPRAEGAVLGV